MESPPRRYLYRVVKASWGVWIALTARASHGEPVTGTLVHPQWPVWLAYEGAAAEVPDSHRRELERGLGAARFDQVGGSPVTVTLLDVSYPETDFQVEGLAVAVCRWAEEEFGLPTRRVDEAYDRAGNRYLFHWS